jgi:hypothetical protein
MSDAILSLTEALARGAEAADLLRAEVRRRRIEKLFAADRLAARPGTSPKERAVETEIRAARRGTELCNGK